eukprot:4091726-Pleurochrysis_carterae.AAC.1
MFERGQQAVEKGGTRINARFEVAKSPDMNHHVKARPGEFQTLLWEPFRASRRGYIVGCGHVRAAGEGPRWAFAGPSVPRWNSRYPYAWPRVA